MEFFVIILIVFVMAIVGGIINSILKAKELKEGRTQALEIIKNLPDFTPTEMLLAGVSLSYDSSRKKLCLLTTSYKPIIYNYSDILQSNLIVDNQVISTQSTSSTIGRAVLGSIVAGGAGAIVGGSSSKRKQNIQVKSIDLKININDTVHPVWKINFLTGLTNKGSAIYNSAYSNAEKWHGILTVLIKQGEINEKKIIESHSTSDELLKLKGLFDNGILTEYEFSQAKKKLLS